MRARIGLGSTLLLLIAAVAVGEEPAKAPDGPPAGGRKVIVQAIEVEPGAIRVEVTPEGTKVRRAKGAEGEERNLPGKVVDLRATVRGPQALKVGDYWIGLQCFPVEGALRSHLKLAEGQGLVIEIVAPDSPAKKAGLQQYDVLVAAGGKPLGKVVDLVAAVEKTKQEKLELELIREGKKRKISVAPAKRPEGAGAGAFWEGSPVMPMPGNPDLEAFKKWHENFRPGAAPPMRFRFLQPGMIVPPGAKAKARPELPANLTVTIVREANQPAQIVVRRGDKKWEVTEKNLGKLPDDVRPHIERMLGRIPKIDLGELDIDIDLDQPQEKAAQPGDRSQRQLEEMNRQLEQLRKAVEKLQKNAKPSKEK